MNNLNNTEKIIIGFLLYLTWALIAYNHKEYLPDFVLSIKGGLFSLGFYHVLLKNPKE